jgi:hypothetical protein
MSALLRRRGQTKQVGQKKEAGHATAVKVYKDEADDLVATVYLILFRIHRREPLVKRRMRARDVLTCQSTDLNNDLPITITITVAQCTKYM